MKLMLVRRISVRVLNSSKRLGGFAGVRWKALVPRAKIQVQRWVAVSRNSMERTVSFAKVHWQSWAPLAAILALQAVVATFTLRNTAFQDEANYLYAGKHIVQTWLGVPLVPMSWARDFSGFPYAYPLLGGIVNMYLGLEAARLLSLAFMLLATITVYYVAKSVYDRESALFATAVFAVQGPVLFLSHHATYDAMSVGLLAVSLLLTLRSVARPSAPRAMMVGLFLFLAFVTKYAGLLFAPSVLALLVLQTRNAHGWKRAIRNTALATGVFVACIATFVLTMADARSALVGSTLDRATYVEYPRIALIQMIVGGGGLLILAAFVEAILGGRRNWMIVILLFGSVLLAPAYHVYKDEPVSLFKHLTYGFLFGAPVAGHALARLSSYSRSLRVGALRDSPWIISLAACLLLFGNGLAEAKVQHEMWPNTEPLMEVLRTQVRPGTRVLSEEHEVPRYYLQDITEVWQWYGLHWFEYVDRNGQLLSENEAYFAAIDEGYFDIVVLRFGWAYVRAKNLEAEILRSQRYVELTRVPFTNSLGSGAFTVWVKKADQTTALVGGNGDSQR